MNSNVKYEYDHVNDKLIVDRILHTPVNYFFNYGYIPNTLSGDGDPLDAIVLSKEKFYPTSYILCKIIGILHTEDEKGIDDKLILVPADSIDSESRGIDNIYDIHDSIKDKLIHFFENYKILEKNKWVKVNKNLGDKDDAYKVYIESLT